MARAANFVIATSMLLMPAAVLAQRDRESRGFTGDTESLPHPVQLPPAAMTLLMSDKEDFPDGPVKDLRCNDKDAAPSSDKTPVNSDDLANRKPQLLCAKISLSREPGTDYLVLGSGNLTGAHILPFWIIHQDSAGVSVLFKTRADGLSIRPVRYNHYREVEVDWVLQTGAVVTTKRYRFNGKGYVEFFSRETHN